MSASFRLVSCYIDKLMIVDSVVIGFLGRRRGDLWPFIHCPNTKGTKHGKLVVVNDRDSAGVLYDNNGAFVLCMALFPSVLFL